MTLLWCVGVLADESLSAITADYNVLGLFKGSIPICPLLAKTNKPCPIAAGSLSIDKTFMIPSIIPSGIPITAQVNVYDQNNQVRAADGAAWGWGVCPDYPPPAGCCFLPPWNACGALQLCAVKNCDYDIVHAACLTGRE